MRKQSVASDYAKFERGDLVGVLANRKTRKDRQIHGQYATQGVVTQTHEDKTQYRLRWFTKGLGNEAEGSLSKRYFHAFALKLVKRDYGFEWLPEGAEQESSSETEEAEDKTPGGTPPESDNEKTDEDSSDEETARHDRFTGDCIAVKAEWFTVQWAKAMHGSTDFRKIWYVPKRANKTMTIYTKQMFLSNP